MKGSPRYHREPGIALIIVIFIVALASIIVVNLAYSTDLSGRRNAIVERSLQAEYLLKSSVNLARALLEEDDTPEDSGKDGWGKFGNGIEVPPELLEISEPNLRLSLEIRPEDAKIKISQILPISSGDADPRWRGVILRLFRSLGFDDDSSEVDMFGPTKGEHANAEQLVGRLIDYMDANNESYNPGGIESALPESQRFPNRKIKNIEEISEIPGFTANRIRKLLPLITDSGNGTVNINFAPRSLLKVLHEEMTDEMVDQIIAHRDGEEGPFRFENLNTTLTEITGEEIYGNAQTGIRLLISPGSTWFQVVGKVEYGTAVYFVRANLSRNGVGTLPDIISMELY